MPFRITDTTPEAERVRLDVRRRLTPAARLEQVFDLSEALRRMALRRLAVANPGCTERELVRLLIRERFGLLLPLGS